MFQITRRFSVLLINLSFLGALHAAQRHARRSDWRTRREKDHAAADPASKIEHVQRSGELGADAAYFVEDQMIDVLERPAGRIHARRPYRAVNGL